MAKSLKVRSQPLRNPGQSLDEEIDRVVNDDFAAYLLAAAVLWVVAVIEWVAKVLHAPREPGLYALIASVATAWCVRKFIRAKKQVRNLRKGRDGEREVAELLEEFKRHGAQVLHDIPDEKGNVDHVVICTRGIFVVETKAWSKPDHVWQMDFDGEQIHIATRAPDAAPIAQCKAEAASIKALLRESTSKDFPVRGVVVFLDWFVNRRPSARGSDIWVLNPKELAGWVRREPESLSDADVAMATLHLKQYVKKLAA
ncbi:MAG: nuclease-related domain-containing protein [Steroidobacteraceae bacterium]